MLTIETTQTDAYVQSTCRNRGLSVSERAASAATAIHVHVAQEFGLTIGTEMLIDSEIIDDAIIGLADRTGTYYSALFDSVEEVYEALDLDGTDEPTPEDEQCQPIDLTQARLVSIGIVGPGEGFPGSSIQLSDSVRTEAKPAEFDEVEEAERRAATEVLEGQAAIGFPSLADDLLGKGETDE